MIAALRAFGDRVLGRGEAAITVPIFDGALKPNQMLADAEIVGQFDDANDITTDGKALLVADGEQVVRVGDAGKAEIVRFDRGITALHALPDGGFAVALGGAEVRIVGGPSDGRRWTDAGGTAFHAVNAICSRSDGTLAVTDGSRRNDCAHWTHDLMERGASGRLIFLDRGSGAAREGADGLEYAFGACASGAETLVSESWRHRLLAIGPQGRRRVVLDRLPVYPSRLVAAAGGGFWLTAFAARTQLVEFVLREPAFRRRMMKEIAPEHWIAPRMRSGQSFLEPMQGAHLRTMGVLAVGAAPVVRPRDPSLARGHAALLAAQPGRWHQSWHRRGGRNRRLPLHARQRTGPAHSARLARHRKGSRCMTTPILELRQATKLYGGVPAIESVDFSLAEGEIHALVGENGAGKSTLTKVMAGVVSLSSGTMLIAGREVVPHTPLEARQLGIAMVFQENSLVPSMTVAQNLFLGQEKFYNRLRGIYIAAQQFLQSLNFDVTPTATVAQLGAAKKQMVEIARAVLHEAKVIIFDEPTASLTPEEKKYFFDLVRELKRRGVSVIFISHALEEALLISDRITVLRDGRHVVTDDTANFDRARVIQAMVGRDLSKTLYAERKAHVRPPGERVLTIENLRMAPMVKNNSLSVFAGQVTGVFGLVGAGRTETFKVVAGLIKRDFFHGGEVLLRGKPVRYRVARSAVKDGKPLPTPPTHEQLRLDYKDPYARGAAPIGGGAQ